jgi:hypothetical protein
VSVLSRIDAFWRPAAPAKRLAALRVLLGTYAAVYATVRIAHFGNFSRYGVASFHPVGVVNLLSQPLPSWLTWALAIATSLAGVAFALGYRYRITGVVFAALLLWVTSYASSWGMVFHTENLMVLQLVVLALAPAADAFALGGNSDAEEAVGARYGWPIRLMCAVTVLAYFIAGVAKLRVSGLGWVTGEILQNYISYDALRKAELGSIYSPLGPWLAAHGGVFKPLAAGSLLMEFGAPLALIGRRVALVWVISAVLFHLGVLAVMAILFPYVCFGFGFACFFRVERAAEWLRRRFRRGAATAA